MAVSFIGGGTRVPGENHRPVDAKKKYRYTVNLKTGHTQPDDKSLHGL